MPDGTTTRPCSSKAEQAPRKRQGAGSSPVRASTIEFDLSQMEWLEAPPDYVPITTYALEAMKDA